MSESSEDWNQYKKDQKERRQTRLPKRQKEIEDLATLGYKVEKKSEYHYRINDMMDVWPIHKRFHNLKTNKRGGYNLLSDFIEKQIKPC